MSFKTKYINYDIEKIVSKADLNFKIDGESKLEKNEHGNCVIENSTAGIPVGNGRFATPVETDGRKICMQLAHTDYLPFGEATTARTVDLEADYGCGIAYFDIDFGEDVLSGGSQYIKYYEGVCGFKSEKADISITSDRDRDLICIKIIDKRTDKKPFDLILKSARTPLEINAGHTAEAKLFKSEESAMLDTAAFEKCDTGIKENDIYCRASLGVEVEIKPTKWHCLDYEQISMQAFKITVNPIIDILGKPSDEITIYIGASVTHDKNFDTVKALTETIRYAKKTSYGEIEAKTKKWFAEFWSKSFIQLDESKKWLDASSVFWVKLMYCMALTKYGNYPPLHQANPLYGANRCDVWGSRVWWFNNGRYEYAMNVINHPEMNDPLFKMIKRNYHKFENAASQYWGSKGIHIPEITNTDGLEIYPEKFNGELKDWYVKGIIPSEEFHDLMKRRGSMGVGEQPLLEGNYTMRFGYDTCDIAELYRMRYLYGCDEEFLKNTAYPILRDAAEFYRNNDILQKKEDGKYHIFPTNYAESFWGATDVIDDVAMIKGLFPIVADYAEKLGVDNDLIPLWREVAENMCDFVTADDENCISPRRTDDGKTGFAMCAEPHFDVAERMGVYQDSHPLGCPQDEQIRPVMDYDLVTHETDGKLKELCMNTLDGNLVIKGIKENKLPWCLDRFGTNCARLGRADLAAIRLPHQFAQIMGLENISYDELKSFKDCDNAYDVLRYKNIFDLQYWIYEEAIMECLIGCCPKKDNKSENVIYIAPAWDMKNAAKFMLSARDGFDVCCEIKDGEVKVAEIYSKCGKDCVIKNTFGKAVIVEFEDGSEKEFDGEYIEFATEKGKVYAVKVNL